MIKLFYTGATAPSAYQPRADKSLGGYVSSVEVVNGEIDTLFGGISEFIKLNRKDEHALIAIKNDGVDAITDVQFSMVNPTGSYSTMDLAVVLSSSDSEGNVIFESIRDKTAIPYYADFDEGAGVALPTLAAGAICGVWIRRKLLSAAYTQRTVEELSEQFDSEDPLALEDDVVLSIQY